MITVYVIIEHLYHDPCRLIGVFSNAELAYDNVKTRDGLVRSVHQVTMNEVQVHE